MVVSPSGAPTRSGRSSMRIVRNWVSGFDISCYYCTLFLAGILTILGTFRGTRSTHRSKGIPVAPKSKHQLL